MIEEWRMIKDFPGYEVSNQGRVKSVKFGKEKILKTKKTCGYLYVSLCKDKVSKNKYIHRLVASAFIPNPDNKPQIDHIDTDKTNNCVSNLRWATRSENMNNPLTLEKIGNKVLCVETGEVFKSTWEAQRQTGINQSHISDCCRGDRNIAGGYHWKYLD